MDDESGRTFRQRPKITIKTRFLVFSDNFDHKYIKKNIVKGTPKPNIMYFGILIYLTYLIDLINAFNCSHVNKNLK